MCETNPNPPKPAFRGPDKSKWRLLPTQGLNDDQQKEAKANEEALRNTLLGSLKMQHLAVLAGSGCSFAADGPSMADIWIAAVGDEPNKKIRSIAHKVRQDLTDKNIEAFLSRVDNYLQFNPDDTDVEKFLTDSKKTILTKCSEFLNEEKLEAHRTFLHRLSRRRGRDQRLKIFTTNYDLCFERAAASLGCVVLDGFSFSSPRFYDPRFFRYDIVRRPRGEESVNFLEGVFLLYKLHGSVNWARKSNDAIFEEINPSPKEACLIYPAAGKYQQSYTQPHLESIGEFLASVREPNTCLLVTGFGFKDDHLSEPILAAATSNPNLRLIIADPSAEQKTAGSNRFWKQFAKLSETGEDIWFLNTDFNDFARLIPDLKSLSPADNLMRAIQHAANDHE